MASQMSYKSTKLQALLEDFMGCGYIVAEVLYDRDRNPLNVYRGLRTAANRLNYASTVHIKYKDNKVYLINSTLLKKYKEEYCEENKEE